MEFISKIVECNGNPTEIIMNKMMKPCSQEELDAMSAQEREGCKYMSPLNTREYVAEEGIICMQDVPVKMRDGITIYVDIYKPEAAGRYPLLISWSFYGKRPGSPVHRVLAVPAETAAQVQHVLAQKIRQKLLQLVPLACAFQAVRGTGHLLVLVEKCFFVVFVVFHMILLFSPAARPALRKRQNQAAGPIA